MVVNSSVGESFPVSETFISLQGEGNFVGRRSLFIRLQYCNLTCTWCDTKYTWHKRSGQHTWLPAQTLKNQIREAQVKHVIFTGGEPCLFDLSKLFLKGIQFHVESNGTYIPTQPLQVTLKDGTELQRGAMDKKIVRHFNWVISPKLSNSGQPLVEKAIAYWSDTPCIFKFVIIRPKDIQEVEAFISQFQINRERVFLGLERSESSQST